MPFDPDGIWKKWATRRGLFTVEERHAEHCWSHCSGYGRVGLRFCWGRDDGKADVVLIGFYSDAPREINFAAVYPDEAEKLCQFFDDHEGDWKRDEAQTA